ncbi:vacuolar protein sorting-associated protein 35, partial [Haematococcus lacustris]
AVIQVFPDSFHLGTLDSLLGALPEMQPGVKVHSVMASLMDRLARYAAADPWAMTRLTEMRAFERFRDAIGRIISAQASMAPADAVEMYVALMNFTGSVHPNLVTNVNQ